MSRQVLQHRIRPQRYDLGLELPVSLHLREGQQMSSTLNLIFEYIMFEKCRNEADHRINLWKSSKCQFDGLGPFGWKGLLLEVGIRKVPRLLPNVFWQISYRFRNLKYLSKIGEPAWEQVLLWCWRHESWMRRRHGQNILNLHFTSNSSSLNQITTPRYHSMRRRHDQHTLI